MGILCDITLDNNNAYFQPGQTISGRLMITLSDRLLLKGLALRIAGYAATFWQPPIKPSKKVPKDPPVFAQRDDYLYVINYYFGSDNAHPIFLEAGTWSYNFAAHLPDKCPSSFESADGHIRYLLEVLIDYPDRQHICYNRTLLVTAPLDLREIAGLAQPFDRLFLERKSIIRFWQKPLQMSLNMPQTGYVPGEQIPILIKIFNHNRLVMKELVFQFNLISTYTGTCKKKTTVKVVRTSLHTTKHSIFGDTNPTLQHRQIIQVPTTPPNTTVAQCRCIQIGYEIEVTVNTMNTTRMLKATVPISIGTISVNRQDYTVQYEGLKMPLENMNMNESTVPSAPALVPPHLIAMRSMEDLSYQPTSTMTSMQELSASMSSLALRDAEFMPTVHLNKTSSRNLAGDQIDFKPKYLYYEIDNIIEEAQNKAESMNEHQQRS